MSDHPFTKDSLDQYLKELAKEFRKRNGKSMAAEIVLIGGASVVINYGFREMTTDIDALIQAASGMHDAIGRVRDFYDLPQGWLNADFKKYRVLFAQVGSVFSILQDLLQCAVYSYSFSRVSYCYEAPIWQTV